MATLPIQTATDTYDCRCAVVSALHKRKDLEETEKILCLGATIFTAYRWIAPVSWSGCAASVLIGGISGVYLGKTLQFAKRFFHSLYQGKTFARPAFTAKQQEELEEIQSKLISPLQSSENCPVYDVWAIDASLSLLKKSLDLSPQDPWGGGVHVFHKGEKTAPQFEIFFKVGPDGSSLFDEKNAFWRYWGKKGYAHFAQDELQFIEALQRFARAKVAGSIDQIEIRIYGKKFT